MHSVPVGGDPCGRLAREAGLSPAGTASSYHGVLLVETPGPWQRDASEVPALAPVVALLDDAERDGRPHRLQLLAPDGRPEESKARTVIHYRRAAGPFAGFVGRHLRVAPEDVVDACRALLSAPVPADPPVGDAPPPVVDLLVCGHGTRDACCGAEGTRLYLALKQEPPADVRVWRTSHTGGHRFAPTGMTFPDGVFWGYLDRAAVRRIVARDGDVASLLPHYRGTSAFAHPAVQVVEGEALRRQGWRWLGRPRNAEVLEEPGSGVATVLLHYWRDDGSQGAYTAAAEVTGVVELPACRGGPGKGTRDRVWEVVEMEELQ